MLYKKLGEQISEENQKPTFVEGLQKPKTPSGLYGKSNDMRFSLSFSQVQGMEEIERDKIDFLEYVDPTYWIPRTMHAVTESSLKGLAGLYSKAGAWTARKFGNERLAHGFDEVGKRVNDPNWGVLSEYVNEEQQKRDAQMSELGFGFSLMNTVLETGLDLGSLIVHMKMLSSGAVKGLAFNKLTKVEKLTHWGKRVAKLGSYRFATTPSEDLTERAVSAAWMMAYNTTPYVATGIISKLPPGTLNVIPGGKIGIKAFFTDAMLNIGLSSYTYQKLGEEYGWWSEEFLQQVIPNFIMDVGMAMSTRNFPLASREREALRVSQIQAAREYRANNGKIDMETLQKEAYERHMEYNNYVDYYSEYESKTHLQVKYNDLTKEKIEMLTSGEMVLARETVDKLNTAFSKEVDGWKNIKETTPNNFLKDAMKQGIKFDETSPAFKTAREISAEHQRTPYASRITNIENNINVAYRLFKKSEGTHREYPNLDGVVNRNTFDPLMREVTKIDDVMSKEEISLMSYDKQTALKIDNKIDYVDKMTAEIQERYDANKNPNKRAEISERLDKERIKYERVWEEARTDLEKLREVEKKDVGKFGDFIKEEDLRRIFKDVLDTKVVVDKLPNKVAAQFEDGKIIISRSKDVSTADVMDSLLEEGVHALRANLGRGFNKQDIIGKKGIKYEDYLALPEEISAEAFLNFARDSYLERVKPKVITETKPTPPKVNKQKVSDVEKKANQLLKDVQVTPQKREQLKTIINRMTTMGDKKISISERKEMNKTYERLEKDLRNLNRQMERDKKLEIKAELKAQAERIESYFKDKEATAKETRKEIVDFVKNAIPKNERAQFLVPLRDAKNKSDLKGVYDRANAIFERIKKTEATNEVRKQLSNIKKDKRLKQLLELDKEQKLTDKEKELGLDADAVREDFSSIDFYNKNKNKLINKIVEMDEFHSKEYNEFLKTLGKKQLQELSSGEIFEIANRMASLVQQSKNMDRSIVGMRKIQNKVIKEQGVKNIEKSVGYKERAKAIIDSMRDAEKGFTKDLEVVDKSLFQKVKSRGKELFVYLQLGAEDVVRIMDMSKKTALERIKEFEVDGKISKSDIIKETIYENINRGARMELAYRQATTDMFQSYLKDHGMSPKDIINWSRAFQRENKLKTVNIKLPDGRGLKITPDERIAIHLHSKNPDNMKHLEVGGAMIRVKDAPKIPFKISKEDAKIISDTMTSKERIVSDAVEKYFNEFSRPQINETSRSIVGYNVATISEYFPLSSVKLQPEIDKIIASPSDMRNFFQKTFEGTGYLKHRVKANDPIYLDGAMHAMYKHMQDIGSYIGYAEPLRAAKTFLNDKSVENLIRETFGNGAYDNLNDFILKVEGEKYKPTEIEKILGSPKFYERFSTYALGANPWVMAKQPISLVMAMSEIDGSYIRGAMLSGDLAGIRSEIARLSPELRDRLEGNVSREMGELGELSRMKKTFTGVGNWRETWALMQGIKRADFLAISRIWEATKLEVKDKYPELNKNDFERVVARRAEQIIRNTQPTWSMKDRSQMVRGSGFFARGFTMFTSQRNKNFRIAYKGLSNYAMSERTSDDVMGLAINTVVPVVSSALMLAGINEARNKILGRKEDRSTAKWVKDYSVETILAMLGSIYVLGNAGTTLRSYLERGRYGTWDIEQPHTQFINTGIHMVGGVIQTIQYLENQERYKTGVNAGREKWKVEAGKTLSDAMTVGGISLGIPTRTIMSFMGLAHDTLTDEPTTTSITRSSGAGRSSQSIRSGYER